MTTRRRPIVKHLTGSKGAELRSLVLNTSNQSLKNAKKSKTINAQNEKNTEELPPGCELNDANISDDEEGGTRIGDIYIPPPIPPHCSTESKGPRLIIKKIENNNFKSYAGKVVLGPFHHCFTAIIGPNGSGKSNVIDSMLFVFGYRANKIRCKKISTLLHNSAKYPNINMCSVAVHFKQIIDKDDGTCDEEPDSDIIVERTAFRDNSSFYTINAKRVQFKEVAKLLKKHNVDLDHNRFLILQGEVESIAMMKPKGPTESECGMLEYLEDIVGTTRYKEPLVKINERVEQLTEERTEKHNRCKLAEREMNDLEQPYNEAIEYLRKENENTRTKNLRIQKYLSEKNKKLQEYTMQHDEIIAELKEHEAEVHELKKEREDKEAIIKKQIQNHENMRKKKEDLEKKLEKANSKFSEIQETMTILNKRRHHNINQTTQNEKQLEVLRKLPEKNQKEIEECENKLKSEVKQRNALDEELQRNYALLKKQTQPLIEEREKLETELMQLKSNVDNAKADLAVSESELKILQHDKITEARKYETMKGSYEESKQSMQEMRLKLKESNDSKPQMKQEANEKTKQLQKLQDEEQQLKNQLMTIKGEINEKVVNMQAMRSNNKVLDFLMRQKCEGIIPGILGRLGDLGGIESKYDVAISTACGRLDNIVVDTVNTAQKCIEYLKRYDVGRASFIALEKIEYLRSQCGHIQTPEHASRLFDLVRVEDKRVIPAFFFALRNTLVAKDLEQGTRIAYGTTRFRVVTINGDVIETSGTMSGGGRTQIRGKMGTKVRTNTSKSAETSMISQNALEDMQKRAEELQSKINFNQEEQGRLEREIYELKMKQQSNESEIQKLLISIKSLEEQLPRILKLLKAQEKRVQETTTDEGKVKVIEASIVVKNKTLKEADDIAVKVSDKIVAIKNQIEIIHEDKINSVQSKIKRLENQIQKIKGNVSKLKVESANNGRNLKKLEQQIERLKTDVLKAQDELKSLSEKRQQFDDEVTALTKEFEENEELMEKDKSESSGIHKEITAIQKKETDLKLKRVEIDQKLQTVSAKLSDVKAQIPHWREQLKPLRLHDIPGESEPQPPLKTYTEEELATHTLQDIQYKESVEEELLKKKPNLSCISEYIEKRDVYLERVKVLEDITCKRNEMRQLYDDVRKKRYNEFMQGFHIITRKLKEMYQMITQGGDAELELVDSMDPFTEGVSFSVRPPKKTWKNISNLSGGEKTLSSLALVFALHYYKPSPLYFMDEIDAALDFKNISIVAHYIKERTKNAQFIIISLRSNMFELADYLVGIYKVKDCTDSVCIRNELPKMPLIETQLQHASQTQVRHSQPDHQHDVTAIDSSNISSAEASHVLAGSSICPNNSKNRLSVPAVSDAIDNRTHENNENNSVNTVVPQTLSRQSDDFDSLPQGQSTELTFSQLLNDRQQAAGNLTFIPNGESTSLPQISPTNSKRTSNITQDNTSFSENQFKKPLPPVTTN